MSALRSKAAPAGPRYADLPGDIDISLEFSPPNTGKLQETLWQSIETLAPLRPRFVSVTYGAGGSTRERTHATVERIVAETRLPAAAHLTCVNASRAEIDDVLDQYWEAGVRHIVALRGDPPAGEGRFRARADGYADAAELVAGVKARHPFEVSVGAYPEVHPEAESPEADLAHLKRKIEAGASRAITQFFFDPEHFLRFQERARMAGIEAEIVPGILPIGNFAAARKMAGPCHVEIPGWLERTFAGLDDKPAASQLVAATVAADLVRRLYERGVRHFHFYTLNRAELTYATCHLLGVRPNHG